MCCRRSPCSVLFLRLCTNELTTDPKSNNDQEHGDSENETWNEWIGSGT